MKIILHTRAFGTILSLLLLCSCATTSQPSAMIPAAGLPIEAALNKGAGRGDLVYVTLHLENGEDLRFILDTGSPYTILGKSLESKLGKQLGSAKMHLAWYAAKLDLHSYQPPRLYFGNTRLLLGDRVLAGDFQILDGSVFSGILGMDCLRHYCVQMDFANGKIRLLDSDNLKTNELGNAFPIILSKRNNRACVRGTLGGIKDAVSIIDTGMELDGALEKKLFQQNLQRQKTGLPEEYKLTTGKTRREAMFPDAVFGGGSYTNLNLSESAAGNWIGLGFLARHLVTLDFPKQTMFLKQTSIGPLMSDNMDGARKFLRELKKNGKAPGWPPNVEGMLFLDAYTDSGPVHYLARRFDDPSTYHYMVSRPSPDRPWKLERAWRTSQNGNLVEEYSVP